MNNLEFPTKNAFWLLALIFTHLSISGQQASISKAAPNDIDYKQLLEFFAYDTGMAF